jgi:hypothetical protein
LYYYGYRFYNPELMRWLNRDPIGTRGGLNEYGFVKNNPINKWDYLGLLDLRPCCNGSRYNPFTHCCCAGTLRSREDLDTGVKTCTEYGRSIDFLLFDTDFGGNIPRHRWIEIGGVPIGFWPEGVNQNDPYGASTEKQCKTIKLSPCKYDIEKFKAEIFLAAGQWYPSYNDEFNNCVVWTSYVIARAKLVAKGGCTQ